MKKISALLLILISGCAHQHPKMMVATGGSRSDGIVKMSYDVGAFERVKVDPKQGAEAAKQRCIAWGYENAEAFGGESRTCAYL